MRTPYGNKVYGMGAEFPSATALYEESLAVARKLGDRRGIGGLLISLGRVALRREDIAAAHTHCTEALALQRKLGNRLGVAWALEGLAEAAAAREQPEHATRLLAAAESVWEQLPSRQPSLDQGSTERLLDRLHSSLGDEVAGLTSGAVVGDAGAVRDVVKQYEDLGIDELFFNASTDDPDEVERLAEAVR